MQMKQGKSVLEANMAGKKGLGIGMGELMGTAKATITRGKANEIIKEELQEQPLEMDIDKVSPNKEQPRKNFSEDSLQELSESIRVHGVIEPLIVAKRKDNKNHIYYQIIAGERRWRAAKIAQLKTVPVIVKEYDDTQILEIALIENIQREDLNPMDEAVSISNIIKLRGYTQDEFANKFGKSRTYVTNILGLLKLPEDVKKMVEKRTLSMSHARVLSKIDDEEKVVRLAKQVITDELSVRELEKITQDDKKEIEVVKNKKSGYDHKYRMYENIIMDNLDTKVRVSKKKIEIYFDGVNELEEILSKMNVKVEEE